MSDWLPLFLLMAALPLPPLAFVACGLETDLFTLRRYHVKTLSATDPRLAPLLRFLLKNIEENRIRITLLAAFFQVCLLTLTLIALHRFLPDWLGQLSPLLSALGAIVALTLALPKSLSLAFPGMFLKRFSRPFIQLIPLVRVFSTPLAGLARQLEKMVVPASFQPPEATYTETEFETLLEIQQERGALHEMESSLISEFIKLGNKTTSDCMTARVHAFALPSGLNRKQIFQRLEGNNWRKVPIYHQSLDEITGVLDVRKALQNPERNLSHAISSPVFVSGLMPILTAFRDYLAEPHSIVIVLDEYGGTQGVLTHEDILEEIVGQMPESSQKPAQIIHRIGENLVLASGGARIEDVEQALGVELDAGGLDTIGGLVFNQFGQSGRVPSSGDRIALGPAHAIIRRVGKKRIEEVLVERAFPE